MEAIALIEVENWKIGVKNGH